MQKAHENLGDDVNNRLRRGYTRCHGISIRAGPICATGFLVCGDGAVDTSGEVGVEQAVKKMFAGFAADGEATGDISA
jgi:hypothetical protein